MKLTAKGAAEVVADDFSIKVKLPTDRLEHLMTDMINRRVAWNKEIYSDHLTVNFISETTDDKYLLIVDAIKKGEWEKLPYSDPNFIRDLWKAFRLEKINEFEFSYGEQLYFATKCTGNEIKLYNFFDAYGPYNVKSLISYMTDTEAKKFKSRLEKFPNQCCYATSALSPRQEAAFFFDMLRDARFDDMFDYKIFPEKVRKVFLEGLNNYCKKLLVKNKGKISLEHLKIYNDSITILKDPAAHSSETTQMARNNIQNLIWNVQPDLVPFISKQLTEEKDILARGSVSQLVEGHYSAELDPLIIAHPFDPKKLDAPCLSSIIPSPQSNDLLQKVLFVGHEVEPELVAGAFTVRHMATIDRLSYGSKRAVSSAHPDVKFPKIAHGIFTEPFYFMEHDRGFHIWRSGQNPLNKLDTRLSILFKNEKEISMIKSIWRHTDKDIGALYLYLARNDPETYKNEMTNVAQHVISNRTQFFTMDWVPLDRYDDNLLILTDMQRNKEFWNEAIKPSSLDLVFNQGEENDKKIFATLNKIIDKCPERSDAFCVATYRLLKGCKDDDFDKRLAFIKLVEDGIPYKPQLSSRQIKEAQALQKIKEDRIKRGLYKPSSLTESHGIEAKEKPQGLGNLRNFLQWKPNGGIYLQHSLDKNEFSALPEPERTDYHFRQFVAAVAKHHKGRLDTLDQKIVGMIYDTFIGESYSIAIGINENDFNDIIRELSQLKVTLSAPVAEPGINRQFSLQSLFSHSHIPEKTPPGDEQKKQPKQTRG